MYPIPELTESTSEIQPNLASVTELVETLSTEETFISNPDSGSGFCTEIQAETEAPAIQKLITEDNEKMTPFQLLAIFLIFCLIILALSVMWDNLYTTLFICCITLPILKWMGKI